MKLILGIMSGTSMDALDAALVAYRAGEVELLAFATQKYLAPFREKLLRNAHPGTSSVAALAELNVELSRLAASLVAQVLQTAAKKKTEIECVGYHGQTLWHDPSQGVTLQIGDGPTLAALTGIPVVNNFRTKDMAYGGQGAPLVPFAQKILFQKHLHEKIAVHNLGGISNLSYFSPSQSLAFDTGPANLLLDGLAQRLFGQDFDKDGRIARSGTVNESLLQSFLSEPYFRREPPKSTGREMFGADFLETWLKTASTQKVNPADVIATATELTVRTIGRAYEDFVLSWGLDRVILCGGGAKNSFLVERLTKVLPVPVTTSAEYGIDPQTVEAACFAILGHLGFNGKINQMAELTGTRVASSLGQISYP